jgi:hypothetical protein
MSCRCGRSRARHCPQAGLAISRAVGRACTSATPMTTETRCAWGRARDVSGLIGQPKELAGLRRREIEVQTSTIHRIRDAVQTTPSDCVRDATGARTSNDDRQVRDAPQVRWRIEGHGSIARGEVGAEVEVLGDVRRCHVIGQVLRRRPIDEEERPRGEDAGCAADREPERALGVPLDALGEVLDRRCEGAPVVVARGDHIG